MAEREAAMDKLKASHSKHVEKLSKSGEENSSRWNLEKMSLEQKYLQQLANKDAHIRVCPYMAIRLVIIFIISEFNRPMCLLSTWAFRPPPSDSFTKE